MKIPGASRESKEMLRSFLPKDDGSIAIRPMFGNLAAFVNGNMFAGLYGDNFFVRLPSKDIQELLGSKTAVLFSPMKGRPMKEYIMMPRSWIEDTSKAKRWISKSLDFAKSLPPKAFKKRV